MSFKSNFNVKIKEKEGEESGEYPAGWKKLARQVLQLNRIVKKDYSNEWK